MPSVLRHHLSLIHRLTGWRGIVAFLLSIATAASEGLSLLLLVPLLRYAGLDVGGDALGTLDRTISGALAVIGMPQTLAAALVLYAAAAAAQIALVRYQSVFHIRLEQDLVRRVRQRLYDAVFASSWLFLAGERRTDISHALTREVDRVGAATAQLHSALATLFVGSIYLALAFVLSPALTLVVLASGVILLVLLRSRAAVARNAGEQFSSASADMYGAAIELLAGVKTIKSQGREAKATALFSRVNGELAEAHVRAADANAQSKAWFDLGAVVVLAVTLFVAVGVTNVAAGTLLLLLFLFARIMPRIAGLQQGLQHYVTMIPSLEVVSSLETRAAAAAEGPAIGDARPFSLERSIVFDNVGFRFADRSGWTLRHLDLVIRAGETAAIVGASGAGKSTIVDLMTGLLMPNEGIIAIDDEPLERRRIAAWRDRIGYVDQDTFLLHDTVRANLLWAQPSATDEEIHHALRLAAADGFVAGLPLGLDTTIGDRGVTLSGGERQRLSLARALLRRPLLLILDEATSALDSENEQRIQRAIEGLHGTMTILVIAHRLSTIRSADTIHVLDGGRIVESGSWSALLARPGGRFHRLYETQEASAFSPAAGLLRA